ncbi:hypothetical protein [Sandaracinus amylolyticus]|uniref:Tryptophan synthase alpha chain n=1 Tax=Sandaracinus amylolyticus TaxID=927083 RepID=A0A0F6W9Z3_9BACT|nr:hypothetical protein [Sandaracinus amylolyticus]AKF11180.1 Tryptophan synthase alpha chain [Sandaracinus amylolyticus]
MSSAAHGARIVAAITLVIAASACEGAALEGGSRRAGGALACAPICDDAASSDGSTACSPGTRCVAGRCVGWALRDRCTVDLECGTTRSICGTNDDCAVGEVCVDPGGGVGRCAWVQDPGVACDGFGMEIDLAPIAGGAAVRVCVEGGATCRGGSCSEGCESDAQCTRPGAPWCDAVLGECVCRGDEDCVGPGGARCVDGVCIGGGETGECSESTPAM